MPQPPSRSWIGRCWTRRAAALAALIAAAAAGPASARALAAEIPVAPEAIERHLQAFAEIAVASGGARAAGTVGYRASADYVADALAGWGYQVERRFFTYDAYQLTGPVVLAEDGAEPLAEGLAVRALKFAGSGAGRGRAAPVDLSIRQPERSSSACDAADFADFPRGAIALAQRGGCAFEDKARLAAAAGAAALVIFNQGDRDTRKAAFPGDLGPDFTAALPVFAIGFDQGADWADKAASPEGLMLSFSLQATAKRVETVNVIADSPEGDPAAVLIAGAHLDSVAAGPGLNDNASGVAALLAIAEGAARGPWRSRLRFAFWGAEELGLFGSRHYVLAMPDQDRARIAAYLNFDMLASVNGHAHITDGDRSEGGRRLAHYARAVTPQSKARAAAIERLFEDYFIARGIPWETERLDYASDYVPFFGAGIPVGGVYAGAGEIKTEAEVARHGGQSGAPKDPCYHQACDTLANVDRPLLLTLTRAAAHVIGRLAAEDPAALHGLQAEID